MRLLYATGADAACWSCRDEEKARTKTSMGDCLGSQTGKNAALRRDPMRNGWFGMRAPLSYVWPKSG